MQEAKKNGRKFWGEKRKIMEHSGWLVEMEGFCLFLGGLLDELLIFSLRLVLLSCCVMS